MCRVPHSTQTRWLVLCTAGPWGLSCLQRLCRSPSPFVSLSALLPRSTTWCWFQSRPCQMSAPDSVVWLMALVSAVWDLPPVPDSSSLLDAGQPAVRTPLLLGRCTYGAPSGSRREEEREAFKRPLKGVKASETWEGFKCARSLRSLGCLMHEGPEKNIQILFLFFIISNTPSSGWHVRLPTRYVHQEGTENTCPLSSRYSKKISSRG